MKITRKQLRRLIEASIIKKGDYTIPVEEPLKDPREQELDISADKKDKLMGLAMSGESETRVQADEIADAIGFHSSDRFGADTLSKQIRSYDLDIDLLNDSEINQILDHAIALYFRDNEPYEIEDLLTTLRTGYVYKDFKEFLEGNPSFDSSNGGFADLAGLDIGQIGQVMDKAHILLKQYIEQEPSGQRLIKYEKAKELFKRRKFKNMIPAVTQQVYDKMLTPMYQVYRKAIFMRNPKQDMTKIKEASKKKHRG